MYSRASSSPDVNRVFKTEVLLELDTIECGVVASAIVGGASDN